MSSAAFLNQDFGSESEDEAFNPAPAEESDNDAPRDFENDGAVNGKANGSHGSRQSPAQQVDEEVEDDTQLSPSAGLIDQDTRDSASRKFKGEDGDDTRSRPIGGLNGARDNEEEDVDDDEEDEEEDEEAISGRPRKRARRDPRNQFIDEEAEVDEEDEGDEEDEEGNPDGFIAETHPDDNLDDLPENVATDDTRHRDLDRQREKAAQLDAEHEAQRLRETYGRRQATTSDANIIPKRLLLPSVDDPSIWGVKCKPGKEREIVFALMKRIEERAFTKNPLPIISALERKNISGYLYVEARRQADVLTALEGIINVYPRSPITLVPIKEMPDLLRVTKSEQLQAGGYVRIKRGKYASDLAQIDDVETNGLDITLRVVPRLDYGQNDDGSAPMVDGGIRVHGEVQKRKRLNAMGLTSASSRPPPRLFSEQEAKKKHSKFLSQPSTMDTHHWQYHGDTYINGFLIKDFKIQHLITENVNPTLEEVTRFSAGAEDGAENLDLAALAATLKKSTANDHYLPGDMVEVFDGEQQGAYGKAIQVRGDIVTMTVLDGDLRGQIIEVPQKGLRKRFRTGDHVKVIGGSRYRDEVGMVVSINADQVTLLSDLSMQEITVFSKDLREASDSGVAGGLGRYDIHDLVQLDPATVGCVTKVDRESLRVLDQVGSVRSVMPSQISNKIEKRRNAVATDRNGSEIRTDDTVREIGGEQKQGVILHIYRSFLFLHNREQTENSGISVVRTTNVATVAAKGGRVAQGAGSGPDLNKMNPALMRNGVNGSAQMPPPKSFGRDRALGQTVTIRRGAYKGLLGIVKDTTDLEARVELHTKGKTVTVPKDTLGFKDSLTGLSIGYAQFAGSRGRGGGGQGGYSNMGGATPGRMQDYSGGRTPLAVAGGRTPAWGAGSGGRTPAFTGANSTAKTPMWRSSVETSANGGGRTPAYTSSADGSRTVNPYADGSRTVNPYGGNTAYGGPSGSGGGGRTPAWNPTATASSYSQDPFANTNGGGGGRTPAYEPSYSRTPGPAALSSRPYDAPTPGKDFATAPTPSANGGSSYGGGGGGGSGGGNVGGTPAAGGVSAPTPKFSGDAPTPFAGQPETPGWGAGDDDDGPRYEEGTPSP